MNTSKRFALSFILAIIQVLSSHMSTEAPGLNKYILFECSTLFWVLSDVVRQLIALYSLSLRENLEQSPLSRICV